MLQFGCWLQGYLSGSSFLLSLTKHRQSSFRWNCSQQIQDRISLSLLLLYYSRLFSCLVCDLRRPLLSKDSIPAACYHWSSVTILPCSKWEAYQALLLIHWKSWTSEDKFLGHLHQNSFLAVLLWILFRALKLLKKALIFCQSPKHTGQSRFRCYSSTFHP